MNPKYYIDSVRRQLDLPPFEKMKEINFLKREFCAAQADGLSMKGLEERLGTPQEAAERIRSRYPEYEHSPLRLFPLALLLGSGLCFGFNLKPFLLTHTGEFARDQVLQALEMTEYIPSADCAAASQSSIAAASSLSYGEILFLSVLGIIIGIYFYFFFYYMPKN